jgi:hypothetical protein
MDINYIVEALKVERTRIDAAISALTGQRVGNGRRRRFSAAARKRLSETAKVRWANAKKAGKNSL